MYASLDWTIDIWMFFIYLWLNTVNYIDIPNCNLDEYIMHMHCKINNAETLSINACALMQTGKYWSSSIGGGWSGNCVHREWKMLLCIFYHHTDILTVPLQKMRWQPTMAILAQTWPALLLQCSNCTFASIATTGYCDPTIHIYIL